MRPFHLTARSLTRVFAVALALSTTGCFTLFNASTHAGMTTVASPPATESNVQVWRAYYYDQFDAYEGAVVAPSGDAPEAQRQGYQLASSQYARRVESTKWKNVGVATVAWTAILVGIPLILAGGN